VIKILFSVRYHESDVVVAWGEKEFNSQLECDAWWGWDRVKYTNPYVYVKLDSVDGYWETKHSDGYDENGVRTRYFKL